MSQTLSDAAQSMRQALAETVRKRALWFIAQGGLMVLAGLVAIIYPMFASLTVIVLLGWLLIISGVVQGLSLIGAQHVPHFWMQLTSVVLGIIVGLLFLSHPEDGLLSLALLFIVFFFVEGVAKIIFSLTVRPLPNWGWVMVSGVLAIILASVLWTSLPISAAWILGLLLGIALISEGAALAYFAWSVRNQTRGRA